jgi:hypothetical protein
MEIWGGIGIGTGNSLAPYSGACGGLLAPYKVSLPSPNPLISPVTSSAVAVCRLSKPHS